MAKKFNFLILLVSITTSIFCQSSYPKIVVIGQDTVVTFSKEQVKGLAMTKLERNMFKEMSDSCYSNAEIMKRKIDVQEQIIINFKNQLELSDSIIQQHKNIEGILQNNLQGKDEEIKKQKRRTSIAIGVAILTTIIALWR
jgi:hypothetical protein